MKVTKSIFAVLVAVALVLTMTAAAFAATGTPNAGSLTVTGDKEFNGKTVEAYRVFTASWVDSSQTGNDDDNIDDSDTISYVLNSAWNGFFTSQNIEDSLGAAARLAFDAANGATLSEKASNFIASYYNSDSGSTPGSVLALAKALKDYEEENNIGPTYTSAAAANQTTTISNMTPGYYLVIPQSGSTNTVRESDATLINVPSENSASWAIKSAYPTVDKTVDNDKKETTAQIGDVIPFKLESAVPDMTEYTAYTLKFHDTLSTGFTYQYSNNDPKTGVTITIDGDTVAPAKYNVSYNSTNRKLDIEFVDFKTEFGAKEGAPIVITYNALLNENAVIASTGNPNIANVEYSDNPSDSSSTNFSTNSSTTTYTYQITIDKHDNSATPVQLAGAVFKLKDNSNNTIKLISTGTVNEYRIANADEIAATPTQTVDTVTTPDSGLIVIKGLEAGTYKLEEMAAPTGYNMLGADITVVIAPSSTGTAPDITYNYGTPNYTVDNVNQSTSSTINVINTKGTVLPITGSIGTIGLTALGVGVVVLGIVLTSRKKKKAE